MTREECRAKMIEYTFPFIDPSLRRGSAEGRGTRWEHKRIRSPALDNREELLMRGEFLAFRT